MITLYGTPRTSAGRCYWCLEEIGLSYETKSLNFKEGEHKAPEYLKLNPNGKVPTLVDGELTIWESMAINYYLVDKYKPELLGDSHQVRALVQQWSIWSVSELQPPLIEIFIQQVFVPEDMRDSKIIEKGFKKLPALLSVLEQSLVGRTYLASSQFTLADLNTSSVVNICKHLKVDLTPYKNISLWFERVTNRPAFQKFLELCK